MNKYLLFVHTDEFVELELAKKHKLNFLNQCEILYYADPSNYVSDTRKKIAIVNLSEEIYSYETVLPLSFDLSKADLVVVYSREDVFKNKETVEREIFQSYNNKNICVLAGGIDYRTYSDEYFYPLLSHFKLTTEASDNSITPDINEKNFLFDCLLGTPKPSRKYIYYRLLEDKLLDRSLVSITVEQDYYQTEHYDDLWPDISHEYQSKYGAINGYKSDFLKSIDRRYQVENLEKLDVNNPANNLITAINGIINDTNHGHSYWRRIYTTPHEVYNNTWYSIITETYQNHRYQPTEKTAKAFLGQRIFVPFCCKHFLKNLKNLGFKTFSSIIDESYDEVEDTVKRFDMAWQQVRMLAQSDPRNVYDKVQDILQHNRKIILDPYFQLKEIEEYIYNHANSIL
jgi:hypothetical protein